MSEFALLDVLNKIKAIQDSYIFGSTDVENVCNELDKLTEEVQSVLADTTFLNSLNLIECFIRIDNLNNLFLFENDVLELAKEFYKNNVSLNLSEFNEHNQNNNTSQDKFLRINNYNKCKRANYSKEVNKVLKNWLKENIANPYPNEKTKNDFIKMTGLDLIQINNWFINARRRILPIMRIKKFTNYGE